MANFMSIPFLIGGLGWGEILLIFLVILLLFGAKRLPELARGLGKGIREFKGAVEGVEKELDEAAKSVEKEPESEKSDPPAGD
ncbi:MAG: twin-arginine translocase TatA/TatE family subunit [Fidelibacterota bacterium]